MKAIVDAMLSKDETIIVPIGNDADYERAKKEVAFYDVGDNYYCTGKRPFVSGVGCIAPCDVSLYESRGKKVTEAAVFVRRGIVVQE